MSSNRLRLQLPFPPSVNRYWRHVQIKNRIAVLISNAGREYAKTVAAYIARSKHATMAGPLEVFLGLCPPDNRRRDVDNYSKASLDALTKAGLWEDDSQIKILHSYMLDSVPGGCLWLEVRRIPQKTALCGSLLG